MRPFQHKRCNSAWIWKWCNNSMPKIIKEKEIKQNAEASCLVNHFLTHKFSVLCTKRRQNIFIKIKACKAIFSRNFPSAFFLGGSLAPYLLCAYGNLYILSGLFFPIRWLSGELHVILIMLRFYISHFNRERLFEGKQEA